MTATNHALTGAIIGLVVGEPLIAIPLAIISHYICDTLPHFDFKMDAPNAGKLRSKEFRVYLLAGSIPCFVLVACLAIIQPLHWFLAAVCAFAAAAPDLLHLKRYISAVRHKPWKPNAFFKKLTFDYQKLAGPLGGLVEIAWFVAAIAILLPFLR